MLDNTAQAYLSASEERNPVMALQTVPLIGTLEVVKASEAEERFIMLIVGPGPALCVGLWFWFLQMLVGLLRVNLTARLILLGPARYLWKRSPYLNSGDK